MLRAVADTNAVVSGLLWQGPLRELLAAARARRVALYTSAVLLEELAEVLTRAKFGARIATSGYDAREFVYRYTRLAKLVVPAEIGPVVMGDPDDDAVIACALAAQADLIVSGDKRLRNLKSWRDIEVIGATEALRRLVPT